MEQDELTNLDLNQRRRRASLCLAAALAGLGAAVVVLRAFPPGISRFYPPCPFRQFTGLLCPGCGATRAVAALAQGHFAEAVRWNGLAVAVLALCVGWAVVAYSRAMLGRYAAWPKVPPVAVTLAVASALMFAVMRILM